MSTLPAWIEDRIDTEPSRALTQRRVVEAMLAADRPFFLGIPASSANRPGRQRGTGPESTRGTPRTRRCRHRDGSGGDDALLYRPSETSRITSPSATSRITSPGRTAGTVAGESARSPLGERLPLASRVWRDKDTRSRGLSTQSGAVHARDRPVRRRTRCTGPQRPRSLDRRTEPTLVLCRDPDRRTDRATGSLAARLILTRAHPQRTRRTCARYEGLFSRAFNQ